MSNAPIMTKAQIYIAQDTWTKFLALCKLRHTSASAVLRDAIAHIMAHVEASPDTGATLAAFEAFLAPKPAQGNDTAPHECA